MNLINAFKTTIERQQALSAEVRVQAQEHMTNGDHPTAVKCLELANKIDKILEPLTGL